MGIALVTGSNRGIGLALCRLLTLEGVEVVAACRSASPALLQLPVEVVEGMDVRSVSSLERLADQVGLRDLSWLFCNAGIYEATDWDNLDWGSLERQWQVNTLGAIKTVHALASRLQPGARVGLLSSRFGSIAQVNGPGFLGYRLSKAALNMAGVCLAQELQPRGVSVAILHPGYVKTDMNQGRGDLSPTDSAACVWKNLQQTDLSNTGQFWHADGSIIPW